MRRMSRIGVIAAAALSAVIGMAAGGVYKILKTAQVGGAGGFDYVYADSAGRRLYVPRSGTPGRVTVYDLDSLDQVGEVPASGGHGVAIDSKSHHGFVSSHPVVMWDTKSLAMLKTIDVEGSPDGILGDEFNERIYILSHRAPNVTVIDGKEGTVVGTVDLGGAPEQAVADGKGHIYVDVEDKGRIAVFDAKTLKVTATYDLQGKGGTCAGLAMDLKNNILFASCRNPATMVILNASDGKILETLPIGSGTDGATFNPKTMEAFSSQGDGTLTVVKENSSTSFTVEQTVQTPPRAKTLTLDSKSGHLFLITAEFKPAPSGQGRGQMVPDSFSIVVVGK
ncbi:MAG TPA: hypothetical protein VGL72_02695 [Bryobacteraceae bacterium]